MGLSLKKIFLISTHIVWENIDFVSTKINFVELYPILWGKIVQTLYPCTGNEK
jgi:hypothetical protein